MRFLVTRLDALHGEGSDPHKISNSRLWPIITESESHESAVADAYRKVFGPQQPLPLGREFLVVALIDATVVTYKPKQDYTTHMRKF